MNDFIVVLKAATNGITESPKPKNIEDAWNLIKKGIKRSQGIEEQVWKNLDDAKFFYRTRNFLKLPEWQNKSTLQLKSRDALLGALALIINSTTVFFNSPVISADHVMLISTDHVTLISTAWAEHDNAIDKTGAAASRPPLCGQ